MKLSIIAALLFAAAGAFGTAGGVHAQTNVCGANPGPVDASDPSVIVTAPADGASVTSPIHVTGQARVFEATVSLRLVDAGGVLVETTTQSAEGSVLAAFSADVAFSVTSATDACLWVYESSARDGSPVNVVQIPLTLNPSTGLPSTGTGAGQGGSNTAWLLVALSIAGVGLAGGGLIARRVRA